MIKVICQRSGQDSTSTLSQHRPTSDGLKSAEISYQWWNERWSKVYPTKQTKMNIWLEYKGVRLSTDHVREAINDEFGLWAHISRILDEISISENEE